MPKSTSSNTGNARHIPKRAVFPGQFDPITNGHLDVIRRGVKLFDELIVAVGINPEKRGLFTLDEREEMIRQLLKDVPGIANPQIGREGVPVVRADHDAVGVRLLLPLWVHARPFVPDERRRLAEKGTTTSPPAPAIR